MASLTAVLTICLAMTAPAFAQLDPLLLGLLGAEGFEAGSATSLLWYDQLQRQLQALQFSVATGAVGGCESGVIGPFSSTQGTADITFRGHYLTRPSISLSLSDLNTLDANTVVNFQIRPIAVTTTGASISFTDASSNVVSAYVSYMVCPSNSGYSSDK